MKKIALLFISLFVFVGAFTADAEDYDFRKVKWGMSRTDVLKAEKDKPTRKENEALVYSCNLAGMDCVLAYSFTQDKLARSMYILSVRHTNTNDYIADFEKTKDLLIKKYGDPLSDDVFWKNDLYKDDSQHWGMAISIGHLFYRVMWENEKTQIMLALYGENFQVRHTILYTSKEFEKLADESQQKDSLEGF